MNEPLVSMIGTCSETKFARNIIEGRDEVIPDIENLNEEENEMLKCLIRSFGRPKQDGVVMKDLEWNFNMQQYRETFTKVREDTAVGPSGLLMALWKAACYDDTLAEINSIFIEIPFKYGFALERWKHVVHTMIPKVDKPYITKLRNIQLVEADYNGALKYIIGRKLRRYCESNGTSSENTFGGRTKKNCIQMLKTIQTINEVNRINFVPQAHLDIDAIGCFDNMATSVIGMAIQRIGGDRNLAITQTRSLIQQEHRVKTMFGISPKSFCWNEKEKLGGSGQGSGASMVNWHSFNEAIIKSYKNTMELNKTKYENDYHVKSFVDDNKLLYDFKAGTTLEEIKCTMRRGIETWSRLLNFTGGELSSPKCFYSVVQYKQKTDGTSKIVHNVDDDYDLKVSLHDGSHDIQHVEPRSGLRLLGVRMSTSGNFNDEFKYRRQQSIDMANLLKRSKLSRVECYLIYKTRFKPKVHYPLPITTFTDIQAEGIEKPFINELLPKLGVNRKMPRAVVFAPRHMGGLGITKITYDQIVNHTCIMLKHLCNEDTLGENYERLLKTYQINIGCHDNFFRRDPNKYFYKPDISTNTISYLWSKLWEYGITLKIPKLDELRPPHERNRAIMDIILEIKENMKGTDSNITDTQIRIINKCRLYCGVTWISEIVENHTDMKIKDEMFDFHYHKHKEGYPYIENINEYMWRQWIHALYRMSRSDKKIPKEYMYDMVKHEEGLFDENIECNSLADKIESLKPGLRQIIGKTEIHDKTIESIVDKLRSGKEIYAWTDGSKMGSKNGHGYILMPKYYQQRNWIEGYGRTVKGTTMSSLRSEHCGVLAILLILKAIEDVYGANNGTVRIWSDSMTVVNRIKEGNYGMNFAATDYDLWKLSLTIVRSLTTKIEIEHVKAHQDRKIGPLSIEQHYNVMVDKIAKKGCDEPDGATIDGKGIPISVFVNNNQITASVKETLYNHIAGKPIKEYMKERFKWSENIYGYIDWKCFGTYASSIPVSKIANIIKYIYDWQYNKKWETRIKEGGNKNEIEMSFKCPMGCGEDENHRHYMVCKEIIKQKVSERMKDGIKIWLKKNTM